MKSLILGLFLLITSFTSIDPQRLALLPQSMSVGENLSSICIDVFRDAPVGEVYRGGYRALGHSEVEYTGSGTPSRGFLGETPKDIIPAYYKTFIDRKISEYNRGEKLSYEELTSLQNEVWTYNALDIYKYINRQSVDQVVDFENAKKIFKTDFQIDGDDIDREIIRKAKQIRNLRKANPTRPTITDLTLTEDGITCRLNGEEHTVPIHYDGISHIDLSAVGKEKVKDGFRDLTNFVRVAPYEASLSGTAGDEFYILIFSVDDYPTLQKRYLITNDRGTSILSPKGITGQSETYAKRK